ncbi:MAG: hypothetical protein ACLQVD_03560 [Capsulimonadaceae bacterium]
MNHRILAVSLAAIAVATPAFAAPTVNSVNGHITSINATLKTVTVESHHGRDRATIQVPAGVRIVVDSRGGLALVQPGAGVKVWNNGGVTAGATAVTADRIDLLPAPPHVRKHPRPDDGYRPHAVEGVVGAVTPSLTITTPSGNAVTITTTPQTKVIQTAPGTFESLAVGAVVHVKLADGITPPTAKEIHVSAGG